MLMRRCPIEAREGSAAADVPLSVGHDPDEDRAYLAGEDVSAVIRGDEVTKAVSAVSAVPSVRTRLVALQRELAAHPSVQPARPAYPDYHH